MVNFKSSISLALIVSMGGFIFGFDAAVISGVIGFVTEEFNLTTWQQGFVVSSPTLGAIVASLIAGYLSDRLGRKPVLIIIAALYSISAIFSALAVSVEMLILARFIGGLAFASLIIAPLYIAEISPSHQRGRLVSFNQFNIMLGFSVAYFTNYFFIQLPQIEPNLTQSLGLSDNLWRWMLGIEIVPAMIYTVLLFFIPRSPRWLVLNNGKAQAKKIINMIMAPADANEQWLEITSIEHEKPKGLLVNLSCLFSPQLRAVLILGLFVGVIQQITGINAIYFYAPTIFEQTGIGRNAAFIQSVMVGITNLVFTVISMLLIDLIGRKPLMIVGLLGIFVSMTICAYGFSQSSPEPMLILVGILAFVASFALSLGPVMWVLLSEIFPSHIRGLGIAFIGVINSVVSFCVQLIFPWQLEVLGASYTFAIYAAFAFIGLFIVIKILPETRGLSLEQLEYKLKKSTYN